MAATMAGPSRMLLRSTRTLPSLCSTNQAPSCSYAFSTSSSSSYIKKTKAQARREKDMKEVKGPKNTPPGTNAKPGATGRPKRYDTTYGIPPLNPAMFRKGAEKLNRQAEEKAQQPDFEKMWRLQDEISSTTSARERDEKVQQLADLRANQPKRHPLWAFFHEKTKRDQEDAEKHVTFGKDANGQETIPPAGYYSLAYSLDKPNREASRSGRSWDAAELRRKSFDDLHKLWYILLMERNVLNTQKDEARRNGVDLSSYTHVSEQLLRIRKSMARIKYVLSERRYAATEAQELVRASTQADEAQEVRAYGGQANKNFIEENIAAA